MPGVKIKAGFAGLVIITGYLIISAIPNNKAHAATCPALPDVAWWQTTHDKIVRHVDHHYGGKWDPYIEKWEGYRDKMQTILDKEGTAIVKSRGVRLKGAALKKHIRHVEKRIRITRCLKLKNSGQLASLNSLGNQELNLTGNGVAIVYQAAKQQAFYLAKATNYTLTKADKVRENY